MKTNALASMAALLALWSASGQGAPVDAPTPPDPPVKRGAVSGERQVIGFHYSLNDDCSARQPAVSSRIVAPPSHGTLAIVEEDDYPDFPKTSVVYECNRHKVPGLRIFYRSEPGYSGDDSVTLENTYPTGRVRVVEYAIEVWAAAQKPEPVVELPAGKRADIDKLLELTGMLAAARQTMMMGVVQRAQALRLTRPDIPERIVNALPGEIMAVVDENSASYKELMAHVYDRHFTAAEIRQLVEFYGTDLGKRLTEEMPKIAGEMFVAVQVWAKSLEPQMEQRIKSRLLREGYNL